MSGLTVLVVGSGGREHALGWALARSESVAGVEAAPGNPGLESIGAVHPVPVSDEAGLVALVREKSYGLVVIGPEQPLAAGLADRLRGVGTDVFGPGAAGARLESSKAFAKAFMKRHDIPTAPFEIVESRSHALGVLEAWGAPVVVKASGLAAGKGVAVAETVGDAERAVNACFDAKVYGAAGSTVVLEKKLEGEEVSVFVITDGTRYHILPGSQDHKRAFDRDEGPNTGGMGAYSPAPVLTPETAARVESGIVRPILGALEDEGMAYRGLLYIGLMMTKDGPQVLEFNVRFGDPETQVVLPRMEVDWGEILLETARGELRSDGLGEPVHRAAACVVAAAADYPRSGANGLAITGIDEAETAGALVFHAGTARRNGELVTSGGRILNVVGRGDSLREAVDVAYHGVERIHFEGMRYRSDIGHRALGVSSVSNLES